ncbi:MAG: helix-turn-helix domain-containing protein [Thermoprotei archaeon]
MFMSDLPVDIFDVLSNETRRRILEILAEEPAYLNQLTKEVRVSQQAILKHLEYLQERGVIRSFIVKGEGGTPPKKYYELDDSLLLLSELAKSLLSMSDSKGDALGGELRVHVDLAQEKRKLEEIGSLEPEQRIKELREYVCSLEDTLERLAGAYQTLTRLKVEALSMARRTLREKYTSPEDRRMLYRAISMDDEELREYFKRTIESQREWVERVFNEMKDIFGEEY